MVASLAWIALVAALAQSTTVDTRLAAADAAARRGETAAAVREYRALLDDPQAPTALVLYRLAALENRLGDYASALTHAVDAAGRLRAANRQADAADALNLAGLAELNRGNYAAAAAQFDPAIRLSGDAQDWAHHAEQLSNLGNVYYFQGRYDDASRIYGQARDLAEAHAAEAWATRRRQIVVANQAALHQRLGGYQSALQLYRNLSTSGAAMAPDERAQMLVNEGALFRRLGDPYKALDAYATARRLFTGARQVSGELAALSNTGIALALDLGRFDDAAGVFTEAFDAAVTSGARREQLLAQLYRGESLLRAGRFEPAQADFTASVATAEALGTKEEQWKALYGLGRVGQQAGRDREARVAFDRAIAIIDGLREALAVPSTRAEFFQDKREVYDARIGLGLGTDTPDQVFAFIERSRARAWRDRVALDDVTVASVQRQLPVGAALLAYWHAGGQAAVVRVTREDASVTPLAVEIADVTALADALRHPEHDGWRGRASELGRALLPPPAIENVSHLIVVPDGPLGSVPFEALLVNGHPLADRMSVSYLPTAALMVNAVPPASGWRPPWARQLAAFGDPLPAADAWSTLANAPRLAASALEVRAIAAAFAGTPSLFLGRDNRKAALLESLRTPPTVLHVATHGTADLVAGERSRLLFSPDADGGAADSLFLREVYELPLKGVALVVLSACDTERGPDVRGEGVQGFSRALLAAGAASSVTTLWRVADGPTAELMRVFYQRLQAGDRRDDALVAAKRAMIESGTFAHPHYWAAFVLTGEAGAVPRAVRWRDAAAATLMIGGVALLTLWLRS